MMHHQISKPSPRGKPITNKMYLSLKLFSIARLEVTEVTHLTIVTKITVISALMHFALLRSATHSFNRCGLCLSMLPAGQGTQSWVALWQTFMTWTYNLPDMSAIFNIFFPAITSNHHPHQLISSQPSDIMTIPRPMPYCGPITHMGTGLHIPNRTFLESTRRIIMIELATACSQSLFRILWWFTAYDDNKISISIF